MSVSPFTLLEETPLFTLTRAYPEQIDMVNAFTDWPPEKQTLLQTAADLRTRLCDESKASVAPSVLSKTIEEYLPAILAVEEVVNSSPTIKANNRVAFKWRQTPIVAEKWIMRKFKANNIENEVLHVIWLQAIMCLNDAFKRAEAEDVEGAIQLYKKLAGIYHYLASDHLRVIGSQTVPIEFQPPVFNSLMTLALAQLYSLIAAKGEGDGYKATPLGKLCYAVSVTFSNALESVKKTKPVECIHPQYVHWVEAMKEFYYAISATFLAYGFNSRDDYGKAVGLLSLAKARMQYALELDPINERINEPIRKYLEKLEPLLTSWRSDCLRIYMMPTLEKAEAEQLISTTCVMMPNLPQHTPYVLPDPMIVRDDPVEAPESADQKGK